MQAVHTVGGWLLIILVAAVAGCGRAEQNVPAVSVKSVAAKNTDKPGYIFDKDADTVLTYLADSYSIGAPEDFHGVTLGEMPPLLPSAQMNTDGLDTATILRLFVGRRNLSGQNMAVTVEVYSIADYFCTGEKVALVALTDGAACHAEGYGSLWSLRRNAAGWHIDRELMRNDWVRFANVDIERNGIPEVLIFDGYGQGGNWTGDATLVSLRGGEIRALFSTNSWECRREPATGEAYCRHHLSFVVNDFVSGYATRAYLDIVDIDTRVQFVRNPKPREDMDDWVIPVGPPQVQRVVWRYCPQYRYYSKRDG